MGRQRPGDRPRRRRRLTHVVHRSVRAAVVVHSSAAGDGIRAVPRASWWPWRALWSTVWAALRQRPAGGRRPGAARALRRVPRPHGRPAVPARARMPCARRRWASGRPRWVRVRHRAAMPSCWAGARFEGPLRLAVTAYKDEGRRDLRDELARLLGAALTAAADDPALRRRIVLGEEVLVVPVPTARASRRRRGDDPVGDLAVAATAAVNVAVRLRPTRPLRSRGEWAPPRGAASSWCPPWCTPGGWPTRPTSTGVARRPQPRRLDDGGCGLAWSGAWAPPACSSTTSSRPVRPSPRRLVRCTTPGARHVVAATCATTPRHLTGPALVAHRPSD